MGALENGCGCLLVLAFAVLLQLFSTFGYETLQLLVASRVNVAIFYVVASVLSGAGAAVLGSGYSFGFAAGTDRKR